VFKFPEMNQWLKKWEIVRVPAQVKPSQKIQVFVSAAVDGTMTKILRNNAHVCDVTSITYFIYTIFAV
jgi:hypothetical protein